MNHDDISTSRPTLPTSTQPPAEVRLRAAIGGSDYRELQHLAIETGTSVGELVAEAVRMFIRYYRTQGMPTTR